MVDEGFTKYFDKLGFHSKACFEELASRIGINSKITEKIYSGYLDRWDQILDLLDVSFLSEEHKVRYLQDLTSRREKFIRVSK